MKIKREELLGDLEQVKAGLSPREFIEQSSCLKGSTVLHTLEGDFTIDDLVRQGKTDFLVYSCDGARIRIGQARNLHRTRRHAETVIVSFDTGHSIQLTPDHLVMLREGTYCKAGDLKVGDSIMPFNHKHDGDYLWVYPHISSGRERAHTWAFRETHGRNAPVGWHVHHKNENTWNNHPDNLEEMEGAKHLAHHTKIRKPGALLHVREMTRHRMMGNQIGRLAKGKPKPGLKGNGNAIGSRGGGGTRDGALKAWETRRAKEDLHVPMNHKVSGVFKGENCDVYDLHVEKYHNFAANGIFVHNCFVFQDNQVMTFNDEVACRKEIGISVTGAVQATSLLDILTKLDDVFLAVRETESQLQFRGERKEFGVVKDAEIFLPIDRVETPEKWHKLSPKFIEAIGAVERCVSTDESRFTLTCVHIHPDYIEACDNHQLMRVHAKIGIKKPMLVRGSSIAHVRSLSMNQIAATAGWVHFKNETGLILSCRKYEDSYPALDDVITFEGQAITLPKSAAATSDRAAVFATDKSGDPLLHIKLSTNRMLIKGTGLTGYYQEYKDLDYEGPTIEFGINPELFKWLCENYNNAEISGDRFKAKGDDEGHSWEYVSRLVPTAEEPEEKENEKTTEAE